MKKFDVRAYSISDFVEWKERGLLDLAPEFQRRSVWSIKAKSYLIDTIIRGKPIPKILITQRLTGRQTVRTVVDGQQRLRAILEFISGDFKISSAHNRSLANKIFDDLGDDLINDFYKYEIGVDLLYDVPLADLLDIFARLNTYTVKLNSQELLNANYLGHFKNHAYALGYNYVQYFLDAGILSKAQVSRMKEAELSSDLLVSILGGVQTIKNVEQYYKKYEDVDEQPEELIQASEKFDKVMSYIGAIYAPEELRNTNWKRPPLFYSLFNVITHGLFGVDGLDVNLRPNTTENSIGKVRVKLDDISARYDKYTTKDQKENAPIEFQRFIDYARSRTTDTKARQERAEFICKTILNN